MFDEEFALTNGTASPFPKDVSIHDMLATMRRMPRIPTRVRMNAYDVARVRRALGIVETKPTWRSNGCINVDGLPVAVDNRLPRGHGEVDFGPDQRWRRGPVTRCVCCRSVPLAVHACLVEPLASVKLGVDVVLTCGSAYCMARAVRGEVTL